VSVWSVFGFALVLSACASGGEREQPFGVSAPRPGGYHHVPFETEAEVAALETRRERPYQELAPPPNGARSVEAIDDGTVLFEAPRHGASRRGTVRRGTRLPFSRRLEGTGCEGETWVEVLPDAFVCEVAVRYSVDEPAGVPQPAVPPGRDLPFTYGFVRSDGARLFARPSDYDVDDYVESLGEGFGLVIAGREPYAGVDFLRTRRGYFIERSEVGFARGSDFQGVDVTEHDVGWVTRDGITLHAGPNGRVSRRARRRDVVHIVSFERDWLLLGDGTAVRDRDVARMRRTSRPSSVGEAERWIDVDVAEQVMVAYEGDRPVFATLVSTGRAGPSTATPIGEFHIWIKLATSDMDDLQREDVDRNYAIEAVPWVQYFEGSNGFHAAFWHDDFGRRRSHGCVNLSPRDARRLFEFTSPDLPDGWYAVLPAERDQATLVRVRDG
jgi:hypothetical protein